MTHATKNTTGERIAGRESAPADSALLDVKQVAALLRCSTRHVYRLADAGKMPRPLKLGALVRWDRAVVLKWISDGCPPARVAKGGCKVIQLATPKRRDPAWNGAGASRSIGDSDYTLFGTEAIHRQRLVRPAHHANPTAAAIATATICQLRQQGRFRASGGAR